MSEGKNQEGIEIDWSRELGREVRGQKYVIVLPAESRVVRRMVTAGVYKLLSGHEVSAKGIDKYIEESPSIKDEQAEVKVRGLLDQADYILSESTNYSREWEEAIRQGERAEQWLIRKEGFDFITSYSRWQMRPIESGVSVYVDKKDKTIVRLISPMAIIAGMRGFPQQLLRREIDSRRINDSGLDPLRQLRKITDRFRLKFERVLQEMFDGALKTYFIHVVNDCDHTEFDEARVAILNSGEKGYPILTAQQQWKLLSERERIVAQRPRHEALMTQQNCLLSKGRTGAKLEVSFWTEGEVWFDPTTMRMAGKVLPTSHDTFHAGLYPELTKKTTDMELLDLRKEAEKITTELGFLQPNR